VKAEGILVLCACRQRRKDTRFQVIGVVCSEQKFRQRRRIWRICRGCLPTWDKLSTRHVLCLLQCPLCPETEKSNWHILFVCQKSADCWEMTGLSQVIEDCFRCFVQKEKCCRMFVRERQRTWLVRFCR